jgi:hypothetical protein
MNDWIVGKKDILEYCIKNLGFHSWQSVRYWRKKYKLPVRYLPNGRPFFIITEIICWSIEYDNLRRKYSPPL